MRHPIREAIDSIEQWCKDRYNFIPAEVQLQIDIVRANIPKPMRDWLSVENDSCGPVIHVADIEVSLLDEGALYLVTDESADELTFPRSHAERVEVIRDALTAWLESVEKFKEYAEGLK